MASTGSRVYAGGSFVSMGDLPYSNIAVIPKGNTTDVGDAPSNEIALRLGPNPFSRSTRAHFSLSKPTIVSLTVYDVGGRRIMTLLNRERLGPGMHTVELEGRGLANGVYFLRLRAGDGMKAERFVRSD